MQLNSMQSIGSTHPAEPRCHAHVRQHLLPSPLELLLDFAPWGHILYHGTGCRNLGNLLWPHHQMPTSQMESLEVHLQLATHLLHNNPAPPVCMVVLCSGPWGLLGIQDQQWVSPVACGQGGYGQCG